MDSNPTFKVYIRGTGGNPVEYSHGSKNRQHSVERVWAFVHELDLAREKGDANIERFYDEFARRQSDCSKVALVRQIPLPQLCRWKRLRKHTGRTQDPRPALSA